MFEADANVNGEAIDSGLLYSKISHKFDGDDWTFNSSLLENATDVDDTITGVRNLELFKSPMVDGVAVSDGYTVKYLQEFKDTDGIDADYLREHNYLVFAVFGIMLTVIYCFMQWFWTRSYLRSVGHRENDGQDWSVHSHAGFLDLFACKNGCRYCALFLIPCKNTFVSSIMENSRGKLDFSPQPGAKGACCANGAC